MNTINEFYKGMVIGIGIGVIGIVIIVEYVRIKIKQFNEDKRYRDEAFKKLRREKHGSKRI